MSEQLDSAIRNLIEEIKLEAIELEALKAGADHGQAEVGCQESDPSSVQAAFEQFILRMPWPDASLEPDSTFSTWGFLEVASKAFQAGADHKEAKLQAVIAELEERCQYLEGQLLKAQDPAFEVWDEFVQGPVRLSPAYFGQD